MERDKLPITTQKPWGYEILFAHTEGYAGKVIFVRKGCRLSLQYHRRKDETLYVYSGKAQMLLEDAEGRASSFELNGGSSVRIPPQTRHRLHALEDTTIFEVSTPHLDDVIRIEDDYGRVTPYD